MNKLVRDWHPPRYKASQCIRSRLLSTRCGRERDTLTNYSPIAKSKIPSVDFFFLFFISHRYLLVHVRIPLPYTVHVHSCVSMKWRLELVIFFTSLFLSGGGRKLWGTWNMTHPNNTNLLSYLVNAMCTSRLLGSVLYHVKKTFLSATTIRFWIQAKSTQEEPMPDPIDILVSRPFK
jgi:hypothetical protein